MLKIQQISKTFNNVSVLKDISLTVNAGELVHITGGNGSGKSTLFKIMTGLLTSDSGTVTINDDDTFGALIENPGFLEYETARTNLAFLANLNGHFDTAFVTSLLMQFDLDINNKQPVAKYSVGMRQKLGIVQAVMENQTVILLDEPTRGLDKAGLQQFIQLVHQLVAENKIVIIASHDNPDGLRYTHEFILENGILVHG